MAIENSKDNNHELETRQERRERRLKKKREKIPQHGKGLARVYRNAMLKRTTKGKY